MDLKMRHLVFLGGTMKTQNQKSRLRILILCAGLLLSFQNCGQYNFDSASPQKDIQSPPVSDLGNGTALDEFTQGPQQASSKVDIVFVLNSTSSQEAAIPNTINGISHFLSQLPSNSDLKISVLPSHSPRSQATSGYVFGYNNKVVLDQSSATLQSDLLATLSHLPGASVGGEGTEEEGLAALWTSLEQKHLDRNRSLGIFRPDAGLVVVFIANEADICGEPSTDPNTDGDYADSMKTFALDCVSPAINSNAVLAALKNLQGSRPLLVTSVIFADKNQRASGGEREYGWGYAETVMAANGCLVATNCTAIIDMNSSPDVIGAGLSQIGSLLKQKLNYQSTFTLNQKVSDPSCIRVNVDGQSSSFEFDPLANAVHVDNPGQVGSKISIRYCI